MRARRRAGASSFPALPLAGLRGVAHHLLQRLPPLVECCVPINQGVYLYLGEWEERMLDHDLVERRLVCHVDDAKPTATTGEELEGLHTVPVARSPGGKSVKQGRQQVKGGRLLRSDEHHSTHNSLLTLYSEV